MVWRSDSRLTDTAVIVQLQNIIDCMPPEHLIASEAGEEFEKSMNVYNRLQNYAFSQGFAIMHLLGLNWQSERHRCMTELWALLHQRIEPPCLFVLTSLWHPPTPVEPLLIKDDDDLYAVNLPPPPPSLIDNNFHTSFTDNDLLTMPDPTPLPAEASPQETSTNRWGRSPKANAATQVAASPPLEPVPPPKLMTRIGRTVNRTQKWEAAPTS